MAIFLIRRVRTNTGPAILGSIKYKRFSNENFLFLVHRDDDHVANIFSSKHRMIESHVRNTFLKKIVKQFPSLSERLKKFGTSFVFVFGNLPHILNFYTNLRNTFSRENTILIRISLL